MAEYVRRKRPPASHPYWARLHDRTHPPSCKWALACFGFFATIVGGSCGGSGAITMYDAFWYTSRYALIPAVLMTTIWTTLQYYQSTARTRQQAAAYAAISAMISMGMSYVISCFVIGIFSIAFWYPMSGIGAFRGCLGGLVYGLVLGYFITWPERRNWWYRQANWPRWEEMARLHRRRRHTPEQPVAPVTPRAQTLLGDETQFGN